MPVFTVLSVDDEVQERHKYINEARKRRIVELRRMERERSKEMLSRFKAASAQNAQRQSQFIQDLSLYEQKKCVLQELREIEKLLQTADANQEAAGIRARMSDAARYRALSSQQQRRSALERGNSALEQLRNQKLITDEELAHKEELRRQVKDIENLRARQAVLIARARNLDRKLALEKEKQREKRRDDPYTFVEVTKDSYIPLLANSKKSTSRVPNFQVLDDLQQTDDGVPGINAFLAAEATKNMASKTIIRKEEQQAQTNRIIREELRKTIKEKETAKVADEAVRLLSLLSK